MSTMETRDINELTEHFREDTEDGVQQRIDRHRDLYPSISYSVIEKKTDGKKAWFESHVKYTIEI